MFLAPSLSLSLAVSLSLSLSVILSLCLSLSFSVSCAHLLIVPGKGLPVSWHKVAHKGAAIKKSVVRVRVFVVQASHAVFDLGAHKEQAQSQPVFMSR